MLGWLHRVVISIFGRSQNTTGQVNPTLTASRQARAASVKVQQAVRPHVDRSRDLIAAYEAKDGALRGHR